MAKKEQAGLTSAMSELQKNASKVESAATNKPPQPKTEAQRLTEESKRRTDRAFK